MTGSKAARPGQTPAGSPPGRLTRRRALGIGAAATVLVGGAVAGVRASGYSVPPEVAAKLKLLSGWHYVVITAFGKRILEPESADVASFVDGYALGSPPSDRRDLLRFVFYVEHVAPLASGYARRFTALAADEQSAVLAELERSDVGALRAGFRALKALALMSLYRRADAWDALGYGGPLVDWSRR